MDWHIVKRRYDPGLFHYNAEPEVKWIVEHISMDDGLILDVGCLDSGLLELVGMHCPRILGIDTRKPNNPARPIKRMDIRQPALSGLKFSLIIFLSTLEHVGLNCYGNIGLSDRGDVEALVSCKDLLTRDGRILVTVPFDAQAQGRSRDGSIWERRYNHTAVTDLVAAAGLSITEYLEDRRNEIVCMELTA